jgi:hypothetical protein
MSPRSVLLLSYLVTGVLFAADRRTGAPILGTGTEVLVEVNGAGLDRAFLHAGSRPRPYARFSIPPLTRSPTRRRIR